MQLFLSQLLDRVRHRGAKQRRLLAPRRALEDVTNVIDKAHREHLVGLVENNHAAIRQDHLAAAQQVEHATGRANNDLATTVEGGDLLDDRCAAVDGHDVDVVEVLGEGARGVRHLQREFARRAENQCLQILRVGVDAIKDWQHERRGLAGARLGLADHVLIAQKGIHCALLDWRWLGIPEVGQRA